MKRNQHRTIMGHGMDIRLNVEPAEVSMLVLSDSQCENVGGAGCYIKQIDNHTFVDH